LFIVLSTGVGVQEEAGHGHEEQGEAELKAILGEKASPAIISSLIEWKKQR